LPGRQKLRVMLRVVLLLKTVVPVVSTVKVDEKTGTLIREGVPTTLNPWDYAAIELGLKLKQEYGAHLIAVSMAPPFAKDVLEDVIGMGVDEAILVSDRVFAGSDTLATAVVLAETIRKVVSTYDLILTGQEAADSVTSHVPAQVAAMLGIPYVYYVTNVLSCNLVDKIIRVERYLEDEDKVEEYEIKLPALVSVYKKQTYVPVSVARKLQAKMEKKVKIVSNKELNIDPSRVGLQGSPTKVVKVENFVPPRRAGQKIEKSLPEVVDWLLELIRKAKT